MIRWLIGILLVAAASVGAAYVAAGRGAPPSIAFTAPTTSVGQRSTLDLTVGAPNARLDSLTIMLEQSGRTTPLFSLDTPVEASVTQADAGHLRVSLTFGKQTIPELKSGPARLVATATRKSFLSLRTLSSTAAHDVQVRLEPPRISVVSTHHYLNHGGAEVVRYRATPPDVKSGVRVGEIEYQGFPAAGAGTAGADPTLMVAFFALLHDQDLNTPVVAFARDEAGNEVTTSFVEKVFEKPFRRSRILIDDRFLQRVVPDILSHSGELGGQVTPADLVPAFLKINGDLRRLNGARVLELSGKTAPTRLWSGPFLPLGNAKVEASFADYRTYLYAGKEIDRQVHLGFDLAVTAAIPVTAANAGTVLLAEWLGIFGNCVLIDHGMGVASLYGHLSALDVKAGDSVIQGQPLGRSGMTGLAAGDHLHFTMLVGGRPVNPVEWWDPHWIQDRVDRKLAASSEAP
jgi:murein DD-endopeptidase MepM/ murein hydrolase activator NlpD